MIRVDAGAATRAAPRSPLDLDDPAQAATLLAAGGSVLMLLLLGAATWISLHAHAGRPQAAPVDVRARCDAVLRMIDDALADRRFSTAELRAVEDASEAIRTDAAADDPARVSACVGSARRR